VSREPYNRFGLLHPEHLGEDHWSAISVEIDRLERSLDANDDSQALSDLKSIVEAIAKVTLDINGTPATVTVSLPKVVTDAHELLVEQPGPALSYDSEFRKMATWARSIAVAMAPIRNQYGGSHGRAHVPATQPEMVDLALDGCLMWARWALRRLGYFALGRPETLIRELTGTPWALFTSGRLTQRLQAANLPKSEEKHVRAIGVAVGQRAASGTFVVRAEGVAACAATDDLIEWPRAYRLGVAHGLLTAVDERPTITAGNLLDALLVCGPVLDAAEEITEMLRDAMRIHPPGLVPGDPATKAELLHHIQQVGASRPSPEPGAWAQLALHIDGHASP
jgi:hypothetical protein